jgi:hypothetical protein
MRIRREAIPQGERLAELERARLRLGEEPLASLTAMLEARGVRVIEGAVIGPAVVDPRGAAVCPGA